MNRRNAIALAVAALAVAAVTVWALLPQPVAVEIAQARRGAFEQTVFEDGKTRVRDRYTVSAPLAGRVERITLRAGDPVKRGEAIATLLPAAPAFLDARTAGELRERLGAAEAQRERARAEVRTLEAQRDQARADRERQAQLAKQGFTAPAASEQSELALRVAERSLERARFAEDAAGHDLAQARAAVARYRVGDGGAAWRVTAPVSGAVLRVAQESEGAVALGAPLLEIADPQTLEGVVDVLSNEAVAIKPGMQARVEFATGARAVAARVRLVEPSGFTKVSALGVEEQRVNVVLDFEDNLGASGFVGDAFRIEAHIIVYRQADALMVPVGALFRDDGAWAVFVVRDGRAHKQQVEVPRRNGTAAMVEAGLSAGDRVVVYPSDATRDGVRVVEVAKRR
jgi:HlyD family secretion protein